MNLSIEMSEFVFRHIESGRRIDREWGGREYDGHKWNNTSSCGGRIW